MAALSLEYKEFLSSLTEVEQEKYWSNFAEDVDTKSTCEAAGEEWDSEIESAALRYLKNLKRRKDLSRRQRQTSESSSVSQEADGVSCNANLKLNITKEQHDDINDQRSDYSNSENTFLSKGINRWDPIPDKELDFSEEDNESQGSQRIERSDDYEESDSQEEGSLYEDCMSDVSNVNKINKAPAPTDTGSVSSSNEATAMLVKKFPKSSFRKISTLDEGGFFRKVALGHIRGRPVEVKTFHSPMKEIGPNSEKLENLRKVFQLNHRNLIKMLGMIDVGVNECPQLVYSCEANDISLLAYLHDKDESNPKDCATFGKFSLDIIGACEYLHKNGVVHGYLSAGTVTVRRAYGSYRNDRERKLYLNLFLSDYGIIQLTDGEGTKNLFKASNGKIVHLRWVPKEILAKGSEGANSNYSFASDVWSFGVVLWEMWTSGAVPYGKNRSNLKVEQDILQDCHPLTFNEPSTCPQHVLKVIESIFTPEQERPTFLELQQTFDDFRRHEHREKEKTTQSNKSIQCQKAMSVGEVGRPSTSTSSSVHSTASSRYPRVREFKNRSAFGNQLQMQSQRQTAQSQDLFNKHSDIKKGNGMGRNANFKHNRNINKRKVAVVCLPISSDDSNRVIATINNGIRQFQNQVSLVQALAVMNLASRQTTAGSNNVNVNIDSQQRCSKEQNTQVQVQVQVPPRRARSYIKGKPK